jgi:hypothetical protein
MHAADRPAMPPGAHQDMPLTGIRHCPLGPAPARVIKPKAKSLLLTPKAASTADTADSRQPAAVFFLSILGGGLLGVGAWDLGWRTPGPAAAAGAGPPTTYHVPRSYKKKAQLYNPRRSTAKTRHPWAPARLAMARALVWRLARG